MTAIAIRCAAMARSVPEWVGKSDDAMPPKSVFDRLYAKQGGKDAITGIPFSPGDKICRDHVVPLIDGGENRESNLQLITEKQHRIKTAREAMDRAKTRSVQHGHRSYVTAPQPGSLPGARIKYSRARGVYYDRFTGEVQEPETP